MTCALAAARERATSAGFACAISSLAAFPASKRDHSVMTTPDDPVENEPPRRKWRDRSHADDQGTAIELLTGMLTGELETTRQAVRTVRRSAAEAAGLTIGLARIAVGLLRKIGEENSTEAINVLQAMAPQLHAEALELDNSLGPPLPGSAYLEAHDPPSFVFMAGETMKALGAIHDGIGHLLSPEEGDDEITPGAHDDDEWPVPARRLAWEIMQLTEEAADYFRGTIEWDFGADEQ